MGHTAVRVGATLPALLAVPTNVCEFNPYEFVQADREGHGQTLYSPSKEGKGGAGPLVTALTMTVCEAAEDVAKRNPRGRLRVPWSRCSTKPRMCAVGARCLIFTATTAPVVICLHTSLQSWPQGVEVWGREGMTKLWSAGERPRVWRGGCAEPEFLETLSKLIGDFDLYPATRLRSGSGHTPQSSTPPRGSSTSGPGGDAAGRVIPCSATGAGTAATDGSSCAAGGWWPASSIASAAHERGRSIESNATHDPSKIVKATSRASWDPEAGGMRRCSARTTAPPRTNSRRPRRPTSW